ncbi:hypothetical protein [Spirosoma arcticum]
MFSNLLDRIANWRVLIFLLALYGLFAGYLLPQAEQRMNALAGKALGPIDLTFGINPERTLRMVADYGPAGRAYYATTEMTLDVAYPLIYSLLFAVLLTMLYRTAPALHRIQLLPVAALLLDLLENAMIVTLLNTYPDQSQLVAMVCEVAKLLKWVVAGLLLALVLAGLVRRLLPRPTA